MLPAHEGLAQRIEDLTNRFIDPVAKRLVFVVYILREKPSDAFFTAAGLGLRPETTEDFVNIALEMGVAA